MSRNSQRRRSAEAVMLDAVPAREKLHRCPLYSIGVNGAFGSSREVVTDSGLLLTSKADKDKTGNVAPSWNYKKHLRQAWSENIPSSTQFLFHMGEQRLYLKHLLGEYRQSARLVLDLTKSPLRDRILLHQGMRLVFQFQNQIREIVVASAPKTDVIWGWDCKFEEREFLTKTLAGSPAEIVSSEQTFSSGHDQAMDGPKSNKQQRTDKHNNLGKTISWSKTVTVLSDTLSEVEEIEDCADESMSDDAASNGAAPSLTLTPVDRPGISVSLDSTRKTLFLGLPTPEFANALMYDPSAIADPLFEFTTGVFAAITFCPESRQGYLVIPRVFAAEGISVRLVVPADTALPMMHGDVAALEVLDPATMIARRAVEFCVKGHRLVRSAPDEKDEEDAAPKQQTFSAYGMFDAGLESTQAMKDIGIELRHQQRKKRWNGAVEIAEGSSRLTFLFKNSYFNTDRTVTLGRSNCDVAIADPYLSKHHATIIRKRQKYYLLRPENKPVYLLLGKKDTHARPPLALRTGDVLTLGKSDFKVIFQQRGNGTIMSSREEEMRLKVPSPGRPSCEVVPMLDNPKDRIALAKAESDDYVPPPVFENLESILRQFGITRSVTEPIMLLMSVRGPRRGAFFVCRSLETTIGSSRDADISVPNDRRMSGIHARVYFDISERRWMVQDAMSVNGSFVKFDGTDPILLTIGDVFVMGLSVIKVMGTPQPSSTTSRYGCTPS